MGEALYDVLVYPYQFQSKEHVKKKTGVIKNNILKYPRSMTVEEIAKACVTGHAVAFCHAEKTGSKNSFHASCWRYQQIYALDFDNDDKEHKKLTPPYYMKHAEAVQHAKKQGFLPAFVYTTSSHAEDHQKFRMVFVLDEPVSGVLDHRKVQLAFAKMFSINGMSVIDVSCIDPSRIFYPGMNLVYQDYRASISLHKLLEEYPYSTCKDLLKKNQAEATDKEAAESLDLSNSSDRINQISREIREVQSRRQIASKSLRSRINTRVEGIPLEMVQKYNKHNIFLTPFQKCGSTPCAIRVPEDFDAFCYQINLAELLDLPEDEKFSCILGHTDSDPSASISWHEDRYKYRCFSCGATYDIFGVLEKISGCGRYAVIDWICQTFNIRYETEWQRQQKDEIELYHDYMVMNLKDDYCYLYRNLVRNQESGILNMILDIARMHITDRNWAGMNKPVFFYSIRSFMKKAEYYGLPCSYEKMRRSIAYLAHLGLIEILDDGQITPSLQKIMDRMRKVKKNRYRISCYSIPRISHELLEHAEAVVKEDAKMSLRKSKICREQIIRAEGKEKADAIYVQLKDEKEDEATAKFYERYKAAAQKLIEKKSWTTEEEVINRLKGFDKKEKLRLSGVCMPQLLRELGLQRVPFSKAIEEKYAVKSRKKMHYGTTRIIIPD